MVDGQFSNENASQEWKVEISRKPKLLQGPPFQFGHNAFPCLLRSEKHMPLDAIYHLSIASKPHLIQRTKNLLKLGFHAWGRSVTAVTSPRIEALFCSTGLWCSSCDFASLLAFARRLLRACVDWWRDICLFLTVRTQTQKTILSSLLVLEQATTTSNNSNLFFINVDFFSSISNQVFCSGGFRGGDASPPTSLKVTILAEKSASISNNSAPVKDASPPTNLNLTNPAEKSLPILVKTFFFLETTWFWVKKVWISAFGRKITLNFGEDIRIFEVLCLKSLPTKIF